MRTITVHKLDAAGREVWAYPTRLVARGPAWIRVEGTFDRDDVVVGGLGLRRGDRMLELFFADRWYNVFAILDGAHGGLKAWYCNITRPARLEAADVFAEDLALDLLVYPDGHSLVLDEDEFEGLRLTPDEQARALAALTELRELGAKRQGPFSELTNESAPA